MNRMNKINRITKLLECLAVPKQFNHILIEVKTNPATLSHDLKFCMEKGIIARKVKTTSPIRCEYSITKYGLELKECFDKLARMGV